VSPNQPKTPNRAIRIDNALWDAAQRKARSESRTVSEVVREALSKYVGRSARRGTGEGSK
jgi:hypothetical protein